MSKTPPNVLITGCSSGIGLACAEQLRMRGWRVIATARKIEDLQKLREAGFDVLALDVTRKEHLQAASDYIRVQCNGCLDALVNNAGYGQPGALEDLSADDMRQQFEVNVIGLQALSNQMLPFMLERKQGRIIHISSVVGRVALPFLGIYSASKFAVEALADAQRVELQGSGVQVSLVEPGPIHTRFGENAVRSSEGHLPQQTRFRSLYAQELQKREHGQNPFSLPPEAVAKKVIHAVEAARARRRYKVTFPAYLGAILSRFAPDVLIDAILGRELRKRQQSLQELPAEDPEA